MNPARILFVVSLVVGCTPTFVAAGHTEYSAMVQPMDPALLRGAIVTTLNTRRYQITADQDGAIQAMIQSGGAMLNIAISYGERGYSIGYVSAAGFDTAADPNTGAQLLSSRYVSWMRRLRTLIDRQIAVQNQQQLQLQADAQRAQVAQAQALENARQAELERERLARMPPPQPQPQYAQPQPYGAPPQYAQPQAQQPALAGGFNITRAPNGLGAAHLIVMNEGAEHLRSLQVRGPGEREWRNNELRRTVPPGSRHQITGFPPGNWELRIQTGSAYKEWHHLRFGAGGEYTLVVTSTGWFRM